MAKLKPGDPGWQNPRKSISEDKANKAFLSKLGIFFRILYAIFSVCAVAFSIAIVVLTVMVYLEWVKPITEKIGTLNEQKLQILITLAILNGLLIFLVILSMVAPLVSFNADRPLRIFVILQIVIAAVMFLASFAFVIAMVVLAGKAADGISRDHVNLLNIYYRPDKQFKKIDKSVSKMFQLFEPKDDLEEWLSPKLVKFWDAFQKEHKCCGIDHWTDWGFSVWFIYHGSGKAPPAAVPKSCCKTAGCGKLTKLPFGKHFHDTKDFEMVLLHIGQMLFDNKHCYPTFEQKPTGTCPTTFKEWKNASREIKNEQSNLRTMFLNQKLKHALLKYTTTESMSKPLRFKHFGDTMKALVKLFKDVASVKKMHTKSCKEDLQDHVKSLFQLPIYIGSGYLCLMVVVIVCCITVIKTPPKFHTAVKAPRQAKSILFEQKSQRSLRPDGTKKKKGSQLISNRGSLKSWKKPAPAADMQDRPPSLKKSPGPKSLKGSPGPKSLKESPGGPKSQKGYPGPKSLKIVASPVKVRVGAPPPKSVKKAPRSQLSEFEFSEGKGNKSSKQSPLKSQKPTKYDKIKL